MLCVNCNEKEAKIKFCSRSCSVTYNNKLNPKRKKAPVIEKISRKDAAVQRFLNGEISDRGGLRKQLIRIHGYRCEICEGTEWLGQPIPLELDHISGLANDNRPVNLRLLCPNCHALTPTAKGRNKGNGRKSLGLKLS